MAHNCFIYETLSPVNEMKMTNEGGLMTLSGVFGVCGVRNNNKRVYEKSNYAKCVKEMQQRIQENNGGIPGELEHPQTMNITLENVSHKITKIDIDENGVVTGEIQLLNTPKGKIAQAIVEGGLPLFVSSRAMGQVDKAGNVTLENISSFDLVGTPGFSQAKMHLNESQVCESLGENTWYVADKEEIDEDATPEPTKGNKIEENMTTQEFEDKLAVLEARIADLEGQLEEAQADHIDLEQLANGVQTWVIEEFAPELQKWVESELVPHILNEAKQDFADNIAPKIQSWVIEEFAPEIEKWVCEQYSPEVERWFMENVAPGFQEWCINEFAPEIETWLNESYMGKISDRINESLKDTKDSKLKSISEVVKLLEDMPATKPMFKGRQINEEQIEEPAFIANMPEQYRPKYNMASQEVKEAIVRRAKVFDFTTEGAIERFWENQNFDEIKPAQPVATIDDQRERMIRESFRRHRNA